MGVNNWTKSKNVKVGCFEGMKPRVKSDKSGIGYFSLKTFCITWIFDMHYLVFFTMYILIKTDSKAACNMFDLIAFSSPFFSFNFVPTPD